LTIHWVSQRIISWDEGFHLHVANEISGGKHMYTDFFYVQLPAFPYLLAPLSSPGFATFFIWRAIAAGTGFLLGVLILWYAAKFYSLKTAVFAFCLYGLNGTILAWHAVVHPGGFAEFSTFLSFVFLILGIKKKSNLLLLASGLVLSFGVLLRPIYSPVIVPWIYLMWREGNRQGLLCFIAGFLLLMFFPAYFFLRSTEEFVFETYTFHLIRGRVWTGLTEPGSIWAQKGVVLSKFFALPQTLIIIGFSVLALRHYLVCERSSRVKELLLMSVAFIVFFGHLFLVPVHFYYFVQSLPFFIVGQVRYLDGWLNRNSPKTILAVIAVYGVGILIPYLIYVRAWRKSDRWKKIDSLRYTVEVVESLSAADDEIVSLNPNYLFLSGRKASGLQPWLLEISGGFSEEEKRKYNIPDQEKIELYIERAKPRLVIGDLGWEPAHYRKTVLPWVVIYEREDE
jgi:hypothetical protein